MKISKRVKEIEFMILLNKEESEKLRLILNYYIKQPSTIILDDVRELGEYIIDSIDSLEKPYK